MGASDDRHTEPTALPATSADTPARATSHIEHAFDTSDEPEVAAPRPREAFATVEMTPEMIVREPRAAREPLATMELSSDMILQIAVNGPLAVQRPPMATMELTPDMILPEGMRPKANRASPPAAPPPPRPASAPALPSVIVDQRRLRREELPALEPTPVGTPAPVSRATRATAILRALARRVARAVEAAARAIRRTARGLRASRRPGSSSS